MNRHLQTRRLDASNRSADWQRAAEGDDFDLPYRPVDAELRRAGPRATSDRHAEILFSKNKTFVVCFFFEEGVAKGFYDYSFRLIFNFQTVDLHSDRKFILTDC